MPFKLYGRLHSSSNNNVFCKCCLKSVCIKLTVIWSPLDPPQRDLSPPCHTACIHLIFHWTTNRTRLQLKWGFKCFIYACYGPQICLIFHCIATMCSSSPNKCQIKSQAGTAGVNAFSSTNKIKLLTTPTRLWNDYYLFINLIVFSFLCVSQGLPGPPGEKGENGDVGPMVRDISASCKYPIL